MTNNKQQIAVLTVTYNHEKWLAQCIESVLKQECSIPIVQYIWDDNSKDSTFDVISAYQQKYPDRIIAYRQQTNQGASKNYFDVLEAILEDERNQYIALLDGDDYWCDIHHLENKSAYMNEHNECGIVHSNIYIQHNSGKQNKCGKNSSNTPQGHVFNTMLTRPLFFALTVVMRTSLLKDLPISELRKLPLQTVDHVMELWICSKSEVHFIDATVGVWRRHNGTISTSQNLSTALRWIEHECAQHQWIVSHFPDCSIASVDLEYHKNNMLFGAYFVAGKYSDAKRILKHDKRAREYYPKYARILDKGIVVYYCYFIYRQIKKIITEFG